MDMNEQNIEQIVKQVLSQMSGTSARKAPAANSDIPKTARVAMLTKLEHYDIKEFPIPEVGDDDILVKVEGCGICGTDAHEFKRDPFGLIPVALGHEGTGEVVKVGKNEIHQFFVGRTRIALRNVVSCCLSHDGHRQPQYLATIGIDVFYRFEKYHQRIIVQCTESMGYTSKPTHFIGNCGISHINGRNHVIGRFNELI